MQSRYPFLAKDMYSNGMLMVEISQQLETYKDFLTAGPEEETREARNVLERLEDHGPFSMIRGLRRQGPDTLNTIIHGELWEKNMLFRAVDGKCKILDWKNAKIASATLDLAFFLFSSTNHMTILEHRDKIIECYHQNFSSLLKRLEPKCKEPTLEELRDDFELSTKDCLIQSICTFVQEMQYLEKQAVSKVLQTEGDLDLAHAHKLKIYEQRAMNLLKAVPEISKESDEEKSAKSSPTHSNGINGVSFQI